jgi:hypothetical protein
VTFFLIKKLAFHNEVYFIDVFGLEHKKVDRLRFQDAIKLFILYLLTGIPFICSGNVKERVIKFPYKRYGVRETNIDAVRLMVDKYSYKIGATGSKNILFFEANGVIEDIFNDYEEVFTRILNLIYEHDCTVYIKPHPRKGFSRFLTVFPITFIENYVPAEFIDLRNIDFIFGIETVSMANIAREEKKPVCSLINLFEFRDRAVKEYYVEYLNTRAPGRITFVKTYTELSDILRASHVKRD